MQKESANGAREEAQRAAEELKRKYQEDQDRENLEQDTAQDNLAHPPSKSGDTITGGHFPLVELGLVPFNPSKNHVVSCLDKVVFNPKMKTIFWRSEKRLKVGTQLEVVTVTKIAVMKGIDKDTKLMALINIAVAQENVYNIDRLK